MNAINLTPLGFTEKQPAKDQAIRWSQLTGKRYTVKRRKIRGAERWMIFTAGVIHKGH